MSDCTIEVLAPAAAIVVEAPPAVVELAAVGLRGATGATGTEGSTLTALAGATIHAGRAVRISGGSIYHPDQTDNAHAGQVIGVATQSGSSPSNLVVRTSGSYLEPTWALSPGPVYVGTDGVLTQTPPATGWLLVIGRAINATTLFVDVEPAYFRS